MTRRADREEAELAIEQGNNSNRQLQRRIAQIEAELEAMRYLAANPHSIEKVKAVEPLYTAPNAAATQEGASASPVHSPEPASAAAITKIERDEIDSHGIDMDDDFSPLGLEWRGLKTTPGQSFNTSYSQWKESAAAQVTASAPPSRAEDGIGEPAPAVALTLEELDDVCEDFELCGGHEMGSYKRLKARWRELTK